MAQQLVNKSNIDKMRETRKYLAIVKKIMPPNSKTQQVLEKMIDEQYLSLSDTLKQ